MTLLVLTAGAAAAGAVTAATDGTGASKVVEALSAAGYAAVRDVERDDGLWEAEVEGPDGRWRDVHVVPESWEVLDPNDTAPMKTAAEVGAMLEAQGYRRVRELDLDEAVWDVEAVSPDGQPVELRVHGFTGEILVVERDD
ncbi:MAG: PepSY domain-containing protein [Pseudomonadales bacterium]